MREQMTAFYNAAYGGFKKVVTDGMKNKSWDDLKDKDLNVPAIKERRGLLGKKNAKKEVYYMQIPVDSDGRDTRLLGMTLMTIIGSGKAKVKSP